MNNDLYIILPLTLAETNSTRPWKQAEIQKGKDRLPTIHFQELWLLVSVRVADNI